jgi:hypothetical protein
MVRTSDAQSRNGGELVDGVRSATGRRAHEVAAHSHLPVAVPVNETSSTHRHCARSLGSLAQTRRRLRRSPGRASRVPTSATVSDAGSVPGTFGPTKGVGQVEHPAVNRRVAGSTPTRGARLVRGAASRRLAAPRHFVATTRVMRTPPERVRRDANSGCCGTLVPFPRVLARRESCRAGHSRTVVRWYRRAAGGRGSGRDVSFATRIHDPKGAA